VPPVRPDGNGEATLRPAVKAVLHTTGLLSPARRLRDGAHALVWIRHNRRFLATGGNDGLPMPPARLRQLTTASPSVEWFVESGRAGAESIRALLEDNAVRLPTPGRLLDFGCGCGRVLRHWAATGMTVHGCDYNADLIGWCRHHLRFASFETNDLAPPLPYPDDTFDLVYALSVFTHLPEPLQDQWIGEMARVLVAGGHLIVSTHGEAYRDTLTPPELGRYDAGELVVRNQAEPGSNRCGTFCSPEYVRHRFAPRFIVTEHRPRGARGNPPQDLVLLSATEGTRQAS
jgi:SAM-dependent methyltransferase